MSASGKVPALYKCFSILELLAQADDTPGVNEIARRLDLNKGTVSNILHTLADLGVLEIRPDRKFTLGPKFFLLGNMAKERSGLLQGVRPFLNRISSETKMTALLGIRSGNCAVLIDKVDTSLDIKVSSEVGLQMPPLAGSGIKAMLSQLSDEQIESILEENELRQYTPYSITDKKIFKEEVLKVRTDRVAYDVEEYIEGFICIAIPVNAYTRNIQAAIWALGHKRQMTKENRAKIAQYMKTIEKEINLRFQ